MAFKFPFGFSPVGGLNKTIGTSITSDIERVRNSLAHIFSVGMGERPMRRAFGSNIRKMVFQMIDDDRIYLWIDYYVRQAVEQWEKRISILDIDLDTSRRREGLINVNIAFRIISTNVDGNYVWPFYVPEYREAN